MTRPTVAWWIYATVLSVVVLGGTPAVAAGVRRIEAITGPAAYRRAVEHEELLRRAAALLRTAPENVPRRIGQLLEENRELQRRLERALRAGAADVVGELLATAQDVDGTRVVAGTVEVASPEELRALGDRLRERLGSGAAVLAARYDDRTALFAVATDDLVRAGVRADQLVREVAALTGGSGGGRAHMAQGGVGDPDRLPEALARAPEIVRELRARHAGRKDSPAPRAQ